MAKRIADKELTDRNWDQEEEGEEAGTFSLASEDVMKNRAIKKAKRRNTGSEAEGSNAFKGFKGFSLTSPASSSSPAPFVGFGNGFKGLSNGSSSTLSFSGFSSSSSSAAPAAPAAPAPALSFNVPASSKPPADLSSQQTNGAVSVCPGSAPGGGSREYRQQLTALNCSVRDWITKHVNDNPLCDLNPIFRDYERHLSSIERRYGATATATEEKKQPQAGATPSPAGPTPSSSAAPPPSLFSFSKTSTEDKTPPAVTFNFGQKVDSSVLGSLASKTTPPTFSFSSSQTSLFGGPAPSTTTAFGLNKTEGGASAADENGDEEEEPPKPEVKEVKEDDAFYSKKCKLFYKKEAEFKEKGVGTLHLKHTEDGKTQMIVRADTNLGNILLNILVPASMPCSRVGKNNVMVVCVPNPPLDDRKDSVPTPLLIRVKTAEDADELQRTLQERRA